MSNERKKIPASLTLQVLQPSQDCPGISRMHKQVLWVNIMTLTGKKAYFKA